ncbi:hypothetical protein BAE44_0022917 [Dichanthelium oligosanthes]|uniref:F-box/kelch-repeat protein n=1 Tax=Dichanthelium oligosanthes TaxID=888268 RepID=A0A1E5UT20_9POAL|nr:hypothetical protein BAE44_0022917 [Dichanthelium oligosanthes]
MLSGSDNSARTDRDPTRLPEPAAFRFVAPAPNTRSVATGSDIVVVSSGGGETEAPPTLVYDTGAAALAIGPPLPGHIAGPIVAVAGGGDALYALTTLGAGLPLALEAFSWSPCTRDTDEPWLRRHEWSWKSVVAPPPPFAPGDAHVVSYAAHPDGCSVFVSTRDGGREDTCSFDAERREWTRPGAWALPFRGQGHYDRELDAWVGLDAEPGYVCACQVASAARTPQCRRSLTGWRRSCSLAGEEGTRSGATLAYMGDGKFCLVESVACEDVDDCDGRRVVRVTMFGL